MPTITVPPETVTAPSKALAPRRSSLPTPLLEMAEVAPVMSPRTRMLPLPSKSTLKPPVDMAPDMVRVPMAERKRV